jgi:hypothetical protein
MLRLSSLIAHSVWQAALRLRQQGTLLIFAADFLRCAQKVSSAGVFKVS